MIKLPENYVIVIEGQKAVLAINEKKSEYVAWTKDATGGVCWGHYFTFGPDWGWGETKENAYEKAVKRFNEKEAA